MLAPAIPRIEGQLLEVFSSIQGEGLLIGCRQIFVRMALCNRTCRYCDTPFAPTESCRIEDAPGSGIFSDVANPVSLEVLTAILAEWVERGPGLHHSISLTGGEPLLQSEVLISWLPSGRKLPGPVMNGSCARPPLFPVASRQWWARRLPLPRSSDPPGWCRELLPWCLSYCSRSPLMAPWA
jgi:hypothetical protein